MNNEGLRRREVLPTSTSYTEVKSVHLHTISVYRANTTQTGPQEPILTALAGFYACVTAVASATLAATAVTHSKYMVVEWLKNVEVNIF